uniref:Uncharacterized protein n=1 Tax=Anguilla anguilla TaxID=7936 RepID=A0A0E9Q289_ANGAN
MNCCHGTACWAWCSGSVRLTEYGKGPVPLSSFHPISLRMRNKQQASQFYIWFLS